MIVNPIQVVLGLAAVTIIGLFFLRVGVLDRTGFASATVTGCIVLILGGLSWFMVLVSFLVLTSLFTKYKYENKKAMSVAEDKGGARTWKNVVANGLIVSISALGHGITSMRLGISSHTLFDSIFLGAVSTAAADTLATEIGLLSRGEPRLITSLGKRVRRGVSGGVSPLGELASLLGLFSVGLTSLAFGFSGLDAQKTFMMVLPSGFLGCTLDSVLGATIQSLYECPVCGKTTEKKTHCGEPADLIKGWRVMDNDVVNLVSTFFGAAVAVAIYSINAFGA